MATRYGSQFQSKFISDPITVGQPGDDRGRLYHSHASFDLDGAIIALADEIHMIKLPKGAKVKDVVIVSPTMSTTGKFDVGIQANGVESKDQNYFLDGVNVDAGGQAVIKRAELISGAIPAFVGQKLSAETIVYIHCTEITVATSGIIYLDVSFTQE